MLIEIAPTTIHSSIRKIGTCFQYFITYAWILIHLLASTIITSFALTSMLHYFFLNDKHHFCRAPCHGEPLQFANHNCMTNASMGMIFTFNNKNDSFNNAYSKINLPYCMRMWKIVTNHVNFFQVPQMKPRLH